MTIFRGLRVLGGNKRCALNLGRGRTDSSLAFHLRWGVAHEAQGKDFCEFDIVVHFCLVTETEIHALLQCSSFVY
jgi:hypothetical protein